MLAVTEYQTLIDRLPVMFWRAGPDLRCDFVNAAWLRFTGQSYADAIVAGWLHGVHPDDHDRCRDAVVQGHARRATFALEYRRRRHDGVWRWVVDHVVPPEGPDAAATLGAAVDIHDGRDLTEQRAHHLAELAHELRAPLQGITMWLDLMRGRSPTSDTRSFARAQRLVHRLGALVGDLADLSRVERGRPLELRIEPFDLTEMVQDVVELCRAVDELNGAGRPVRHVLQVEHDGAPFPVRGDRRRLEQVVQNLIENAIKFSTDGGDIHVQLDRHGGSYQLEVRDRGIGVAAADLPHLGQRFFRAGNATRARIPGTGLGLSIIEEIVTAHGGRLEIVSQVDVGTTVIVSLPADGGE
jgi:PAS domain S-box-containing protein